MWRRSLAQVAQRCSRSVKIRIILIRWMIRCLPWKASRRSQGTSRSTRPGSVTSAQTHSGTSWRCQVRRKWSHSIVSENFPSRFSSLIRFPTLGQYDGRSKPLPEYHAKITGFDERVCTCGWGPPHILWLIYNSMLFYFTLFHFFSPFSPHLLMSCLSVHYFK